MIEKEYIELADLLALVQEDVEAAFPDRMWVRAEVSGLSRKQNGHCYLELSQSSHSGLSAKVRATVWATRWNYVDQYFRSVTGSSIEVGMEILARVQVCFHPVYGLSLNIDEVDPDFTLGAARRQRQETIERLEKEGLIDAQKRLQLPLLPYSLAVISAPDAAGYGDFLHHLLDNEYGFVFDVTFFKAVMQGDGAPESIISALSQIGSSAEAFDAVLVMRGGGSELDLACFDDYSLAAAIARCPVPVFTAIGHDKDHHVADMVACSFVKTPTALADLFLECYIAEDQRISSLESRLRLAFAGRFSSMESALALVEARVARASSGRISEESAKLSLLAASVRHSVDRLLAGASHRLDLIESRLVSADPRRLLEKGYLLALDASGVRLSSASGALPGDRIRVLFPDGSIRAEVIDIDIESYARREI